ncbi:hypothetical protein ACFQBY_06920 [Promicromonospora citrea]|uniref:Uncharacterized protein n=1 Tax=Promicromonospora citrea TaxID=43677 RepID=A0A8H9GNV5_9MICO|nr:hypothetical protein [Promicromonospora citrea]NNH51304.1 hypothetical protein [Promicromonospora citrea]GGM42011.1 hypothetical protein GCM10010102_41880 [Promicromonospora citrea]
MTDDVHTWTRSTPDRAPEARVPWPARVPAAVGAGLRSAGRWFAAWVRRLVANPFLWVGLVLGFGTSLLVWESVLLLGVVLWAVGAWVWSRRRTPVLVALGVGLVIGWLPMLFFFVTSLPHTMIGPPGVEYDL